MGAQTRFHSFEAVASADRLRVACARSAGRATRAVVGHCRYTLPGLWVALVFAILSFTPSLLPRPALFQGAITGIDAAIGYAIGVVGAWVWREYADRPARSPTARAWLVLLVTSAVTCATAMTLGHVWQRQLATLVQERPERWAEVLLIPPTVAVVFGLLVGGARGLRGLHRRTSRLLARRMGARAARERGGQFRVPHGWRRCDRGHAVLAPALLAVVPGGSGEGARGGARSVRRGVQPLVAASCGESAAAVRLR